ncbi:hypothetical protein DFH09DRAFT_1472175 [Mycena vulgaris]|nr:hypothetical protein DFH09DRAFT_1472175 [Mycena vulgaris]
MSPPFPPPRLDLACHNSPRRPSSPLVLSADEAHTASIKLQRHALDTSALSARNPHLEAENALLSIELSVLRAHPLPSASTSSSESEAYALAARARVREEEGLLRQRALELQVREAREDAGCANGLSASTQRSRGGFHGSAEQLPGGDSHGLEERPRCVLDDVRAQRAPAGLHQRAEGGSAVRSGGACVWLERRAAEAASPATPNGNPETTLAGASLEGAAW